jgi:hypothetical protein
MGLSAALIVAILFGCIAQHVSCQKLTGNSTGSGITCIPDPFTLGLGQGCSTTEGELSTNFSPRQVDMQILNRSKCKRNAQHWLCECGFLQHEGAATSTRNA